VDPQPATGTPGEGPTGRKASPAGLAGPGSRRPPNDVSPPEQGRRSRSSRPGSAINGAEIRGSASLIVPRPPRRGPGTLARPSRAGPHRPFPVRPPPFGPASCSGAGSPHLDRSGRERSGGGRRHHAATPAAVQGQGVAFFKVNTTRSRGSTSPRSRAAGSTDVDGVSYERHRIIDISPRRCVGHANSKKPAS
jgi:hypothetical protein